MFILIFIRRSKVFFLNNDFKTYDKIGLVTNLYYIVGLYKNIKTNAIYNSINKY